MPDDCIFCKIVKGEIPSQRVYEDKEILAFLDIAPANKGHTLVIVKEHHETLADVPKQLLQELTGVLQKVCRAVVKATDAEGFNVFMNNKRAAGQLVAHAHFHIVPRFSDDGIRFDWPHKKYQDKEIEKYRDKIKELI